MINLELGKGYRIEPYGHLIFTGIDRFGDYDFREEGGTFGLGINPEGEEFQFTTEELRDKLGGFSVEGFVKGRKYTDKAGNEYILEAIDSQRARMKFLFVAPHEKFKFDRLVLDKNEAVEMFLYPPMPEETEGVKEEELSDESKEQRLLDTFHKLMRTFEDFSKNTPKKKEFKLGSSYIDKNGDAWFYEGTIRVGEEKGMLRFVQYEVDSQNECEVALSMHLPEKRAFRMFWMNFENTTGWSSKPTKNVVDTVPDTMARDIATKTYDQTKKWKLIRYRG